MRVVFVFCCLLLDVVRLNTNVCCLCCHVSVLLCCVVVVFVAGFWVAVAVVGVFVWFYVLCLMVCVLLCDVYVGCVVVGGVFCCCPLCATDCVSFECCFVVLCLPLGG